MKTTIELPDSLMLGVKLRAVYERRKLKEVFADLLREGLDTPKSPTPTTLRNNLGRDELTGLPLILCRHTAAPEHQLTPDTVSDILLQQEVVWHDEAAGL